MTITDPRQAGERLLTFIAEDRLVQGEWRTIQDGREMACLLGAAAGVESAGACPASLMPQWMANALPGLFDGLRKSQAQSFARRFGEAMVRPGWESVDWTAVLVQWLRFIVSQAKNAAHPAAYANAAAHGAAYAAYAAHAACYADRAVAAVAAAAADACAAATAAANAAFAIAAVNAANDARSAQADCLMGLIEEEVARG